MTRFTANAAGDSSKPKAGGGGTARARDLQSVGEEQRDSDDDDSSSSSDEGDDDGDDGEDDDDDGDGEGSHDEHYPDVIEPSDYKNGDVVLPMGPYGQLTYKITYAAKVRGKVKIVLAPLAQQIFPLTAAEYEADSTVYQISSAWARTARGYALIKKPKREAAGIKPKTLLPGIVEGLHEVQFLLATAQNPSGLDANLNMPSQPYHVTNFTRDMLVPFFDESDTDVGPKAFTSQRMWKKMLLRCFYSQMVCPNAILFPKLAGGIGIAQTIAGSAKRKFIPVDSPTLLKSLIEISPLVLILEAYDAKSAPHTFERTVIASDYMEEMDMPSVPSQLVRSILGPDKPPAVVPAETVSAKGPGQASKRFKELNDMKDDAGYRRLSSKAVIGFRLLNKSVQEMLCAAEQRSAGDMPLKDPGLLPETYKNLLFAVCRNMDPHKECLRIWPPHVQTEGMTSRFDEPPMVGGKEVWEPGAAPADQTWRRLFGAWVKRAEGGRSSKDPHFYGEPKHCDERPRSDARPRSDDRCNSGYGRDDERPHGRAHDQRARGGECQRTDEGGSDDGRYGYGYGDQPRGGVPGRDEYDDDQEYEGGCWRGGERERTDEGGSDVPWRDERPHGGVHSCGDQRDAHSYEDGSYDWYDVDDEHEVGSWGGGEREGGSPGGSFSRSPLARLQPGMEQRLVPPKKRRAFAMSSS